MQPELHNWRTTHMLDICDLEKYFDIHCLIQYVQFICFTLTSMSANEHGWYDESRLNMNSLYWNNFSIVKE